MWLHGCVCMSEARECGSVGMVCGCGCANEARECGCGCVSETMGLWVRE